MKPHLIYLAVIFFAANSGFSQKKVNADPGFSIGVVTYSPVNLTGADKFFNDDWILPSRQSRTSTNYALGLEFNDNIAENISWKTWVGYSKRNITESSSVEQITFFNNYPVETQFIQSATYEQTSFNINSGINFRAKLNPFQINTGFELSYLHTGQGDQKVQSIYDFAPDTNAFTDYYKITDTHEIPSGNSYGAGIFLGGEYNILKNFSIGAEFHQFLYYSVFTGQTNASTTFEDPSGFSYSYESTSPNDFKQFSFSSVVPVILVKYKF